MKFCSKFFALILVCFALVACGKSADEKALAEAEKGLTHQEKVILEESLSSKDVNPSRQAMPKCEERDKSGYYIVPGGCTKADWAAWRAAGN